MELDFEEESEPKKSYHFVNKLYDVLAKDVTSNVLFCPINIHLILSAVLQGARDTTQRILNDALLVPDPETAANEYRRILNELNAIEGANLMLNNKMVTSGFQISEELAKNLQDNFSIEIESKTGDVSVPNPDIVLSSDASFKSDWFYQFDSETNSKEIFHISNDEQIEVDMLRVRCYLNTKFDLDLNVHLVEIPYKNKDQFKMIILLPFDKDGIAEVEKKLVETDLNKVFERTRLMIIDVWLPKFKIQESFDLSDNLSKVGLDVLFDKEKSNLSGLVKEEFSKENICLSKILHSASLEIDGKGQEPNPRCPTPYRSCIDLGPKTFKVDHPAIFFVVAKQKHPEWSNDIILCGKLSKPCH